MSEIVLIVGGSGFLGQHITREIQERDLTVSEIRILDLKPFTKRLNYVDRIVVTSIIGDICNLNDETCNKAFKNVNVVYHCAAVFTIEYPPSYNEMERVNVEGLLSKNWLTYFLIKAFNKFTPDKFITVKWD